MSRNVGIWVDHRHALVVQLLPDGETVNEIVSDIEKHVRESGGHRTNTPYGPQDASAGDKNDRRFDEHLHRYYDEVIKSLDIGDQVIILGPGEAKTELKSRISAKQPRLRIIAVETTDKMREAELVKHVRESFTAHASE